MDPSSSSVTNGEPLRRTRSLSDMLYSPSSRPRRNPPYSSDVGRPMSRMGDRRRGGPSMDRERVTVTLQIPPELRTQLAHYNSPQHMPSRFDDHPEFRTHLSRHSPQTILPRVEDPPIPPAQTTGTGADQPTGWISRIAVFLGYEGPNARARREAITLYFNVSFGVTEFIVIIALLAYSAHHESPTRPGLSEWKACERPLGVWNTIWVIRVALGVGLSFWTYSRERATRLFLTSSQTPRDPEVNLGTSPTGRPFNSPTYGSERAYRDAHLSSAHGPNSRNAEPVVNLPYSNLYGRVSMMASFITLAWFLTAHILEFTSVNSCRFSSPHLWWLTLAILCILYLTIVEIFILGLLVFILGPVIYLFWNLALLCLGRHPVQNPFYIKPEIGKLSKNIVDQIPLVLYIPPPPDDPESGSFGSQIASRKGLTKPELAYSYPPTSPGSRPPKRRFAFLRRGNKGKNGAGEKNGKSKARGKGAGGELTWEDTWEPGDYPFVRLEGNRAACAICLMDFEAPKKVDGVEEKENEKDGPTPNDQAAAQVKGTAASEQAVQEVQVEEVTQEERDIFGLDELRLDDAGTGPQPLRLLGCHHVFHKTCVDPWLIDVSGRCPVCQQPVQLPEDPKDKPKRNRRHG